MKRTYAGFLVLWVALLAIVTGCSSADTTPAPTQIAQAPEAGFTPAGDVCVVPDVVGLNETAAQGMIVGTGLQPVRSVQYDAIVAEGAVISQTPVGATLIEPCDGYVTIVVSLGPLPEPTATPAPTNTPAPTPTATPVPPTPTPTPDPRLFADDFELGIRPEWGASGNGFTSANGRLVVAEDGVWETSIITVDASDYRIVFNGLHTSGDMDKLQFRFRVQDRDNYMLLEATECWVQRWTHCWEWYKVINGQAQVMPGTRFEGRGAVLLTGIEIEGNVYRTFLDYEQENYFVDDTFSTGGIQLQLKGLVELEGVEVLRLP